MEMDMWWLWNVSCMIFSENKLNSMSEGKHTRWALTVVLNWNNSSSLLFKKTAPYEFPYSAWMA